MCKGGALFSNSCGILAPTKMLSDADHTQLRLHEKWKRDPKSYQKPPPPADLLAPRHAHLVHSQGIREELSFILFVDGKLVRQVGAASAEFLEMDPEAQRKAMVPVKSRPGFHVYYKQGAYWYGIPEHFPCLADAIPYLHSGLRVLIEYRQSIAQVKYFVLYGYERSALGAQGQYRRRDEMCELYGVAPEDCIFEEYPGYLPPHGPLIALRPQFDHAVYETQRKQLKLFGKLL